jgi:hypothetical protein
MIPIFWRESEGAARSPVPSACLSAFPRVYTLFIAYVVNGGNPNLRCAPPTTALPLGNCTVSVTGLSNMVSR